MVLTLGMVVLLFAFYLLYFSDWISAAKQREATAELDKQWRNPRATLDRPLHGDGIAKLSVPVFGPDFVWTVLQGTDQVALAVGPGHYPDTAMPGEQGNFSVGGHRVGKGSRTDPRCREVAPLPGVYSEVVGQEIVLPSQREVIAPVPGHPGMVLRPGRQRALITLTTCHPKFSARQRLIIHGVLVAEYTKSAGASPAELRSG
ncbi:MAG: class E sortase [Actinomycetota bacterium]|nr:class E sortase [Actinomycetota bacterium]